MLYWYCLEYSDCYFVLFFVTVILQLSYTYKLCYLSYRIKEWLIIIISYNRIGGVMVRVFAASVVDRGFEPRSGQTNDYKIDICCFFAKYQVLRRKSKDWLARNQDNVSKCARCLSTDITVFP